MDHRILLLTVSAALAACEDGSNSSAPSSHPEDAALSVVASIAVVDGITDPRFGRSTDDIVNFNPVEADLLAKPGPLAASTAAHLEGLSGESAAFLNAGVFVYALDENTVRLLSGDLSRDIRLPTRSNTIPTSDGRFMVRELGTLDWAVYSVDGTTEGFTQPDGGVVFDMRGDTILFGHRHDGARVLHKIVP